MRRGTTPTIVFHLPFNVSELQNCEVYIAQKGMLRITKAMEDCVLSEDTVAITLSQSETLSLKAGDRMELQIRVVFADGSVDASGIVSVAVRNILKNTEIEISGPAPEPEPEPAEGGDTDGY